MNHEVEPHGFAVVPRVLDADEQRELLAALGPVSAAGRRGLLALRTVAELARSPRFLALVRPHLPSEPFPVRISKPSAADALQRMSHCSRRSC